MSSRLWPGHQSENSSASNDDTLDLSITVSKVLKKKWWIIGFASLFSILIYLYLSSQPDSYQASTMILMDDKSGQPINNIDIDGNDTPDFIRDDYVLTELEVLKSRQVAEYVVGRMNLVSHPSFNQTQKSNDSIFEYLGLVSKQEAEDLPSKSDEEKLNYAVSQFIEKLDIKSVRKTKVVKVSFSSVDPVLAADAVNAVVDAYIEGKDRLRNDKNQRSINWLDKRLANLKKELVESEEKLQSFREKELLVDAEGLTKLHSQKLVALNTRLVLATDERTRLESSVSNLDSLSIDKLMSLQEIVSDDFIVKLRDRESIASQKFLEIEKRYGPKHPKYIAAISELENAKISVFEQANQVAKSIKQGLEKAKENEKNLEGEIAVLEADLQSINRKEFTVLSLKREVETNRNLYNLFLSKYKHGEEIDSFKEVPARVIDYAVPPSKPSNINVLVASLGAFILVTVLGSFFVIVADSMSSTIKTELDVERIIGQPVLSSIPRTRGIDFGKVHGGSDVSEMFFAEAIRSLRVNWKLRHTHSPAKVSLVLSSIKEEGKTTIAFNLARSLSRLESVVLVDADLRRPSVAKISGIDSNFFCLTEYLSNDEPFDVKQLSQVPDSKLQVLAVKKPVSNPQELLDSERFNLLIDQLSSYFDRVIIDSVPIVGVSDSLILSSKADAILFVVKAKSTDKKIINKSLNKLASFNAPVSGIVLNYSDFKQSQMYEYGSDYVNYL